MGDETVQPAHAGLNDFEGKSIIEVLRRFTEKTGVTEATLFMGTALGALIAIADGIKNIEARVADLVQLSKPQAQGAIDALEDRIDGARAGICDLQASRHAHSCQMDELEAKVSAALDAVQGVINTQGQQAALIQDLAAKLKG